MSWTQRIIEVTGARPEPRDIDWTPVEAELGATLPSDYRELCSLLGGGYYAGFLRLLQPLGEAATDGLLYFWRWHRDHPEYAGLYAPYDLYGGPGRPGLLGWGGRSDRGSVLLVRGRGDRSGGVAGGRSQGRRRAVAPI